MKKKIAVIGLKGLPALGGAASVGESIIHELQHTFDFTVYSVSSHTHLESGKLNNYRQIVFKRSSIRQLNTLIYFLRSLLHVMFAERYDLVHVHHGSSGFIVPFLRLKYKTVVTFHGVHKKESHDPKFNRLTNRFLRVSQWLNLHCANNIVSVSRPDTNYLNSLYGERVVYIPNGVSTQLSGTREELPNPYMVFAANRVYEIKGLHLILEAMHNNRDMRRLYVIGDMNHQDDYKERILQLAKGLNVEFTGLIREKNRLFDLIAGADLFLFPSLTEAMSMMLLEVASLGVPIIASDIEANRAVFTDEHVVFFQSGNSASLSEKLLSFEQNRDLFAERAQKALEQVNTNHKWAVIAKEYEKIYLAMLRRG
jgi:glycosyltransferase involved in cell wall biosynthesis